MIFFILLLLLLCLDCTSYESISCISETLPRYFHILDRDHSHCPDDQWMISLQRNDLKKDIPFTMINVGFNKGYNFAKWISIIDPSRQVNEKIWFNILQSVLQVHINVTTKSNTSHLCGCAGCQRFVDENYVTKSLDQSNLKLQAVPFNLFGLDINKEATKLVRNVSTFLRESNHRWNSVKISLHNLAASKSEGVVWISKNLCNGLISNSLGRDEMCHMVQDKYVQKKSDERLSRLSKKVRSITLDKYVQLLMRKKSLTIKNDYLLQAIRGEETFDMKSLFLKDSSVVNHIDVLIIDAEGFDGEILFGANLLIKHHIIRMILFEYHSLCPWPTTQLFEVMRYLFDNHYQCYLDGNTGLWPISGPCWSPTYEFFKHSNVVCVYQKDEWYDRIQPYVMTTSKATSGMLQAKQSNVTQYHQRHEEFSEILNRNGTFPKPFC